MVLLRQGKSWIKFQEFYVSCCCHTQICIISGITLHNVTSIFTLAGMIYNKSLRQKRVMPRFIRHVRFFLSLFYVLCNTSCTRKYGDIKMVIFSTYHIVYSAMIVICLHIQTFSSKLTQIAKFMGPTWGPPGSRRPQIGPMLVPRTLLSRDAYSDIQEYAIIRMIQA